MFYRSSFLVRLVLLSVSVAGLSGCTLFRPYGSKQQMEPAQETPHRKADTTVRPMRLEVITDASGAVVTITVKKSSGLDAIDAYVADSIRGSWPPTPSTRSLVELDYSAAREKRFSDPKVISTSPAP